MVFWGLFVARHHIRDVFVQAFRGSGERDRQEMMSYRAAVFGLIGGTALIFLWLHASGMEFRMSAMWVLGSFIVYMGVARIVAESGLIYVRAPMTPQVFSVYVIGSQELSNASMTVSGFTYAFLSQGKGLFMTPLIHAARLAENVSGDRRKMGATFPGE